MWHVAREIEKPPVTQVLIGERAYDGGLESSWAAFSVIALSREMFCREPK